MAITKFTPQQVPFQASDNLRAFLDDQMQSIAPLLNNAAQRNEDEVIEGDWTFSGGLVIPQSAVTDHQAVLQLAASQITSGTFADARIAQSNITQHQAALTILEEQIADLDTTIFSPRLSTNKNVDYTFELSDAGRRINKATGAGITYTIPPSSSVAWINGHILSACVQDGSNLTVAGGTGVSLRLYNADGTSLNTLSSVTIIGSGIAWFHYIGGDLWDVFGFGVS